MMVKRKLYFSVIIFAVVFLMPLFAQQSETLAVLDFQTEAVSKTEMGAIVEFLSSELFNTRKYIVIDVSQRQTILNEMEFSMSGCTDDSCALEIGKLLSAELIVTGNLSKVGSRYLLSAKMLETETSRTIGTANGKYGNLDELIDGLEVIAATLTGAERGETETVAAAPVEPNVEESVSASEKQPAAETEPPAESIKTESVSDVGSDTEATPKVEPPKIGSDGFDWLAFTLSAAGTAGYLASGLFSGLALSGRVSAVDAYDNYLAAALPETASSLYEDYEYLYNGYNGNVMGVYASSALGAGLSSVPLFLGDSYISFGGKITSAAGTLAYTVGNMFMVMAMNALLESRSKYSDYMSAGGASSASLLFDEYSLAYNRYQTQQYIAYGLMGAGGLFQVGAWLFPGEKEAPAPGILQKIVAGLGYLCMAAGNYTYQIAVSDRFSAENAYGDYMSASNSNAASSLYEVYNNYFVDYEIMSYITYGLWGTGAAAVITALFLPDLNAGQDVVERDYDLDIRPSMTGLGIEVEIGLK